MKYSLVLALSLALSSSLVDARPMRRSSPTAQDIKNGQAAVALNAQFKTMQAGQACTTGQQGCINGGFAECSNGKMISLGCAGGTTCAAVPVVGGSGTAVACTTQEDFAARMAAVGVSASGSSVAAVASSTAAVAVSSAAVVSSSAAAVISSAAVVSSSAAAVSTSAAASANSVTVSASSAAAAATSAAADDSSTGAAAGNSASNSTDLQSSLTLDPSVVATGFQNNGQSSPEAGQVASLTSSNNFNNYCATQPGLPITNGLQIATGSCNPAPMGVIAAVANMPSSKFVNPTNLATIPANQNFTVQMAIKNLDTGFFVNADENYFAAPQFTNAQGVIQGHSHVVIEALTSINQTTPTNPGTFAFFKGLNSAAVNGILEVAVTNGLPAGAYRLSSINSAANHQPVLVAVAQHGSLDDQIYFTCT